MTPRHTAHLSTRRAALAAETGFTLVELLVSLGIVGVLLVIAVPAYLNFQAKSQSTAALSALREVIPSANAYYVENSGLTISNGDSTGIVSADAEGNGQSYCISAVADGHWAHYSGPGGTVIADPSTVTENPCS